MNDVNDLSFLNSAQSGAGSEAALATLFTIPFILTVIVLAAGLYILSGLGLYGMAKKRGFENPYMAFIPIANMWLLGKLVGELEVFGKKTDPALILALGWLISVIPIIGWLASIAWTIYYYYALHTLYSLYRPDNALVFLLLSIFFSGIALPVIFFIMRNDTPPYAFGGPDNRSGSEPPYDPFSGGGNGPEKKNDDPFS
ncbi:MAG: hypothetical protein LBU36_01800 [Clostridiales bacterium]|jgi:hypothetical protein|nr:hypothetical protein [Clostridiales bacterium]